MDSATISNARKVITLTVKAPRWVKDGFNELVSKGLTPQEAVNTLKGSPFFQEAWVQ